MDSEPSQTSKMDFFEKIINSWKPLTIFAKSTILEVWLSSAYVSGQWSFCLQTKEVSKYEK